MIEKNQKVYSREEVEKSTLDYFCGDKLACDVWIDKYCLKDSEGNLYEKNPDDMHHRLANEFARIEANYVNPLSEDDIYGLFKNFKYIVPQGSPMAGIGNDFQITSLSNCFYLHHQGDSYSSIMDIDEKLTHVFRRRGGCGVDLSQLRPSGSKTNNAALSSTGIVPFAERYSNTTKEVATRGRRGALMISCDIKHIDSEDFINAKLVDNKITGANISIKISNEFMDAVINDKDFFQTFPITTKPNEIYCNDLNELPYNKTIRGIIDGTYIKKIKAKLLWDKIIYNAWKCAEPGILFWDKFKIESPSDSYENFKLQGVNPCFSGNEKILTVDGYKTFEELSDKNNINIINAKGDIVNSKIWKSGKKGVIKLINSLKKEIICTPDHLWLTNKNEEVVASNLLNCRLMPFLSQKYIYDDLYVKLGFIQGDGGLGRLKSKSHKGFEINIGKNDNDVLDFFGYKRESESIRTFYTDEFFQLCLDLKFSSEDLPNRNLPLTIKNWSKKQKLSFLCGLFSANGCVIKNHRISFKTTNKILIGELTELLKEFEINSYYTTNKSKTIKFSNGEYLCKESYDLNIGKYDEMLKFYQQIGFIHKYKNNNLKEILINKSPLIIKIEESEEIDVFDFTEPETHWGVVNGYIAHNCAELSLSDSESCRLLVLNLYGYVNNPFTKEANFNFDLFRKHAFIAQKLMDDLVDLEIEKVNKIIEKINSDPENDSIKFKEINLWKEINKKTLLGRRTGLGITAEGDMLAALGYKYATNEAIEFSTKIHKILATESYKSSIRMATERGAFPIWNYGKEKNNVFVNRIIDNIEPDFVNEYKKNGRRNIANLTIAPSGSISLLTKTTSGIEPCYKIYYKRRKKVNDNISKYNFIDNNNEKWEEYNVFHHKFVEWYNINFNEIISIENLNQEQLDEVIKKSPYYNATANDIDWVNSVKLQGSIQQWIDHSISKTVNIREDVSVETVNEIYLNAFNSGCKGLTIYRDGSRNGVLVSLTQKKETNENIIFNDHHAPKRPKRLRGEIHRFQNNLERWIAVVGLLENKPYELFVGKLINGLSTINQSVKECEIVKNIVENDEGEKIKRYDIEYIDSEGNKQTHNGLNHAFNPEFWNYAKLISGILRHGMPLIKAYELIDSLNFKEDHINTWKNGVARTIKKYIKDGEKSKGSCPNCGGEDFEFKESCLMCSSCGFSKCS